MKKVFMNQLMKFHGRFEFFYVFGTVSVLAMSAVRALYNLATSDADSAIKMLMNVMNLL
jgi:hypothetical protein